MSVSNISEVETLRQLNIENETSETEAEKSMRFLGIFNQCVYGMVNFMGKTPWELHPDDEYLQIVDGSVEVILVAKDNGETVSLSAGDVFIVPKEIWHRQFSEHGVKLIFITSSEGNKHSTEENPAKYE